MFFLDVFVRSGNAMGFRLETLTKICDTKSADNQLTLLVYIVETVEMIVSFLKKLVSINLLNMRIRAIFRNFVTS